MPGNPVDLAKPVSDILNFQGQAATDLAAATGQTYAAQGAGLEQQAYQSAEEVAAQNEKLAEVSGQIQNVQTEREVSLTLGSQRAAVASAGFGNSGTALSLARSSRQQGYLQEQITGLSTQLEEGGFAGQAAAAKSEAGAAGIASTAATALATAEAQQGALMKSYAAAEAGAVQNLTGATSGPIWNGSSWVQPTPQAGVANQIAGTAKSGQNLTPEQLQNAAITEGGGTPGIPTIRPVHVI